MEKIQRILEKWKTYIGVKDVKLVVRPYKTRDAFTKLSSPLTIYVNEYLIVEKIREKIVKKLIEVNRRLQ